jgi:uncharacterized membrane protein
VPQKSFRPAAAGGRRQPAALALVCQMPDLAALLVMAVAGIVISAYLTTVHYAGAPLVCSTGGIVNCTQVTTSAYSVIPGTQLPITIPGMLWFASSGGLAIAGWIQRNGDISTRIRIALAQVIWGAAGLIGVLYLVYAEIVQLHTICEWCTGVHVLTLLTFLVALYRVQHLPAEG